MYKNSKRINKNGYVVVENKDHPNSFDTGTGLIGVYEHRLIAEELLDRPLKEGEVVHHLDENKSNNSPDNLLVLSNPMHVKLHGWLNKNNIVPKEEYADRLKLGCVRCKVCEKPIDSNLDFCGLICSRNPIDGAESAKHKFQHPTKEELQELVLDKPTTKIAEQFGVSDKAIEKLCTKLGVEKPPRGYWAKLQNGEQMLAW